MAAALTAPLNGALAAGGDSAACGQYEAGPVDTPPVADGTDVTVGGLMTVGDQGVAQGDAAQESAGTAKPRPRRAAISKAAAGKAVVRGGSAVVVTQ